MTSHRSTLDVLNAQQHLVNARVALVIAQRDRVAASYTVLSATGALSPQILGLKIEAYDPVVHYHQVRDVWVACARPTGAEHSAQRGSTDYGTLRYLSYHAAGEECTIVNEPLQPHATS